MKRIGKKGREWQKTMYQKIKQTRKRGNVKQTYDGYSYDSKKEAEFAMELHSRIKAKEIIGFERQVRMALHGVKGIKICDYYVDFLVFHKDDTMEYIEVKGFQTPVWRIKWKLFEQEYGDQEKTKVTLVV